MGNKVIDSYNLCVGAVVSVLTAIFGIYWYVFVAYLCLNVFDWLSGWAKARKQGVESSAAGIHGIVKKTGYWVIIAIGFLIPNIFVGLGHDLWNVDLSVLNLLGWFTLCSLLINEIRSILENLVEMDYDVPNVLIKGLAVAQKVVDMGDDMLGDDTNENH